MLGEFFYKNEEPAVKPHLEEQSSGCSIGIDEGTYDRRPTVLETSNSSKKCKRIRKNIDQRMSPMSDKDLKHLKSSFVASRNHKILDTTKIVSLDLSPTIYSKMSLISEGSLKSLKAKQKMRQETKQLNSSS